MGRNWTLPMIAAVTDKTELKRLSEYQFQVAVSHYAEERFWRCWYTRKSGSIGSDGKWRGSGPRGEPDLRMVSPFQKRVLWIELKSEVGRLSDDQRVAIDWLQRAGQEAGWFRPRDAKRLMRVIDGDERLAEVE